MSNLNHFELTVLNMESKIITLEEYDNLPYERAAKPAPVKKAKKVTKSHTSRDVYIFKKGEILELDDIMYIQALGGNDWWDPQEEGSDMIIITRDIKIEIKVWK